MKTRIIALLLVMVVALLSFASCNLIGGNKTGTGTGTGSGEHGDGDVTTNENFPWTKTNLVFQMSENSDSQQLPSSSRRYLAGDITGNQSDWSTVDEFIAQRNEDAYSYANVTVTYTYLKDIDTHGWGKNIDAITEEVKSRDPERADVYVNFVYDMVAISLQGAFANLYSSTMYKDGHELAGAEHNYFSFTKTEVGEEYKDTGKDYMYDYMRSLTLSKYKMYCLSSDYFTDMVRAFFVVPVNIGLLETLDTTDEAGKYNSDRVTTKDETGAVETNYTIEDFYQLVNDMDWTYDTLAAFSNAITEQGEGGDGSIDLRDTIGFALNSSSGLCASGILYTTSITIIDRQYDVTKGDYVYSYPYMVKGVDAEGKVSFNPSSEGTHDELITFCNNLSALFKNNDGVVSVSNDNAVAAGYADAIQGIRKRFASGHILFGSIITLGSLEYDEYKGMNGEGKSGYGIVPVPLYRSGSTDKYLTQIHNNGKIGAISYTTEKFSQCSAFLDYQSTHSNDILNEYYDSKLQYDVVGTGVKGNVEMLNYIRANVRSSFDKAFEDALAEYYEATDATSIEDKWHSMIKANGFQLDDMEDKYESVTPVKAWRLYNLETNIYPTLPD